MNLAKWTGKAEMNEVEYFVRKDLKHSLRMTVRLAVTS